MLDLDPQQTTNKIVSFIRSTCKKEKCKEMLIGVSGGVDSATSLTLAVRALGAKNIYPVLLPYGALNDESTKDTKLIIDFLDIPKSQVTVVDIQPFVDSFVAYDKSMDAGRKGNVMARMRMMVLYDLSKKLNKLVIGTENKTEHLLGYYTRFGDEASDIEPIRQLYKTQVYKLAEYLEVPKRILEKSPTAGLWEGQTDEGEFGFSYLFADEVLYLYTERGWSKKKLLVKGYDRENIEKLWWWIEKGNFKDRVPYQLKLSGLKLK